MMMTDVETQPGRDERAQAGERLHLYVVDPKVILELRQGAVGAEADAGLVLDAGQELLAELREFPTATAGEHALYVFDRRDRTGALLQPCRSFRGQC
ncbi:MAG: hypothetical protein EYC70_13275 [Planctomycetota bacterium]|nr:MAG: hypothetical protein EYC70_13275 [Planctomycetota bacterium]